MKRLSNPSNKWKFVVMWTIISIAISTFVYGIVWYVFFRDTIYSPYFRRGDWMVIAVYGFLTYIITNFLHGYKIGISRVIELIYSHFVSVVLINILTYFQIALLNYAFFNPLIIITMSFVQWFITSYLIYLGNKVFYNIYPPKSIIVLTTNEDKNPLAVKMGLMHKKYKICAYFNISNCTKEEIAGKISEYDAVLLPQANSDLQQFLIPICFEAEKNIYYYPLISNIIMSSAEKKSIMDSPLYLCKNSGVTGGVLFVKRMIDVLMALILLVITAPIMLITAIVIKGQDGGPALFKQKRLTKNAKTFELYKFRSMITSAEADGVARLAKQNDSRITAFGKFIRRTRIDELPQLINILKGDLTFVGPRPERPEIAQQYEETFPEFKYRLKVRAGLTGYAQVVGRYNTTPQEKLLMDLYYIRNCSVLFDFEIMLMTAKVLILPESTQGVEKVTALMNE